MPFKQPRMWDFAPVYRRLDRVLDADTCAAVIALHTGREPMVSEMTVGTARVRDSHLYWLPPDVPGMADIYERVGTAVRDFNASTFGFELDGCMDMQLTRYAEGQLYGWHADLAKQGNSRRKLSVSVLLNPPSEFEGGDLQFFESDEHRPTVPLRLGDAAIFPSWYKHQVTPVTRGVRWSLVSWWTGPPFR